MIPNWRYSPETHNLGENQWFLEPCDLAILRMTLKNNRAPLLCYFKLYGSFHSHRWTHPRVTVRKCPIRVKIIDLCMPHRNNHGSRFILYLATTDIWKLLAANLVNPVRWHPPEGAGPGVSPAGPSSGRHWTSRYHHTGRPNWLAQVNLISNWKELNNTLTMVWLLCLLCV